MTKQCDIKIGEHSKGKIHEHHTFCKYMNNPHGYSFEERPSRIFLCNDHHIELHKYIITPILQKFSTKPLYIKEEILWKYIPEEKKQECIKEVVLATFKWLEEKN